MFVKYCLLTWKPSESKEPIKSPSFPVSAAFVLETKSLPAPLMLSHNPCGFVPFLFFIHTKFGLKPNPVIDWVEPLPDQVTVLKLSASVGASVSGSAANAIYIYVPPEAFQDVSLFIISNPLDKKLTASLLPSNSALFKFGNKTFCLGFDVLLALSTNLQFAELSVLLTIKKAGSNPVSTIGPFVEPLPVYEPIDEYFATEAKQ